MSQPPAVWRERGRCRRARCRLRLPLRGTIPATHQSIRIIRGAAASCTHQGTSAHHGHPPRPGRPAHPHPAAPQDPADPADQQGQAHPARPADRAGAVSSPTTTPWHGRSSQPGRRWAPASTGPRSGRTWGCSLRQPSSWVCCPRVPSAPTGSRRDATGRAQTAPRLTRAPRNPRDRSPGRRCAVGRSSTRKGAARRRSTGPPPPSCRACGQRQAEHLPGMDPCSVQALIVDSGEGRPTACGESAWRQSGGGDCRPGGTLRHLLGI